MRIQNNVSAMNAHRYYGINQTNTTKSIAKLSSGYRINSAADDAAGLAISEKMRAQIRGLTMASKNAQDAISLIQTAEGGLQEIDNMVQRIRELVNYASNDTQENNKFGTSDRQKIQDEINQLTQEIDSMAGRVEFNKKKVINGEVAGTPANAGSLLSALKSAKTALRTAQNDYSHDLKDFKNSVTDVQAKRDSAYSVMTDSKITEYLDKISVGGGAPGSVSTALSDLRAALDVAVDYDEIKSLNAAAILVGTKISQLTVTGTIATAAKAALTEIGAAIATAINTTLSEAYKTYSAANVALITSLAKVDQAQMALATAQSAYDTAPRDGGLYFQVGANANQGMQLYIGKITTDWLNIGDGNGVSTISVIDDTGADITAQLDNLDFALSYVTKERSKLGAAQNRLEYTMNSLDISTENLTAAESRIRDTDMAKEMTNFAKQNILFQASTAMLAQANAFPQGVLQLLG
jgi:flagellin